MNNNLQENESEFDLLTEQDQKKAIEFTSILNIDDANIAAHYLKMCNLDLNQAVTMFLEHGGARNFQPASTNITSNQQQLNSGNDLIQSNRNQNQNQAQKNIFEEQKIRANPIQRESIINQYYEYKLSRAHQERQNTGIWSFIKNTVTLPIKATTYLLKYITPVSIRGESEGGEQFIVRASNKLKSISNIKFNHGLFEENLQYASSYNWPLLVFVYNEDSEVYDQQIKALFGNEEFAQFINLNFIALGLLESTPEGQKMITHLTADKWPAFLFFRQNLFDQTQLISYFSLNIEETSDQYYDKLVETLNQFKILAQDEQQIQFETEQREQIQNNTQINQIYQQFSQIFAEQNFQQQAPHQNQQQQQQIQQDRILRQKQEKEFQEAQRIAQQKRIQKQEEEEKKRNEEELVEKQKSAQKQQIKTKQEEALVSLQEEPTEQNEQTIAFKFRLPNGTCIQRSFYKSEKTQQLFNYIIANSTKFLEEESINANFFEDLLVQGYPPKSLKGLQEQLLSEIFQNSNQETILVKD